MFKERIVKFSDGTYGILKPSLPFRSPSFLDLSDDDPTWRKQTNKYFRYCKGDLEKVTTKYNQRGLTYTPLKTDLSAHM